MAEHVPRQSSASPTIGSRPGTTGGREHTLLVKVLRPSEPITGKLSLASIASFLEAETLRIFQQDLAKGPVEALLFLARAWRRSEEGGVVPSTWHGIAPLTEALLHKAVALLACQEAGEKVCSLVALLDAQVPSRLMSELLIRGAEHGGVAPRLLTALARPLHGRHLNDLRSPQFATLMRVLRSSRDFAAALASPPCLGALWMPPFEPGFVWRNRRREVVDAQRPGHLLQTGTLLGWALSPAALDGSLMPPSRAHLTERGAPEWSRMRSLTREGIEGMQRRAQMKVATVQVQAIELVDLMIRSGDTSRTATLEWLAAFTSAAEPRGRQGHVAPEGFNLWPQYGQHVADILQHDESPPFERSFANMLLLQALHSRIHGLPTSGAALNAFAVLLSLVQPIRPGRVTGISPFLGLRSDIRDLSGSWERESLFGAREQLSAAREAAEADSGFTMPKHDKGLFKTVVFWLASKGVATLLLPVLKEACHTFRRIASECREKEPSVADDAWREFLLAEAALMEPVFIERLGHFVNLTFHFLLLAAVGGQRALPPPEPGPAWHALPSALLENILELCDVCRYRLAQGSNTPSGLYAHLDPGIIMTTLCMVMASDSHVRDPSLRGRAVSLMHGLCFAFPSWQDQLNQPPLARHLIPCLVGVFIAVEKAIMSYYDLAYRYKYELRMPVMDLFDHALQHEEHRQVLREFAVGAGRERFLKLLTQLINDSNSQTEEALRTVKEYHSQQSSSGDRPAQAGPGPQAPVPAAAPAAHDEEVLDDDHTGNGEDAYQRSRMKYKKHAKKYFALASKTWRQLWLLCKHCASAIVEGRTILEQLLHSSLDSQLHYLVGPEMKHIKASPQEYEELGFNPKEMIRQIVEIYLFLSRVNSEEVARIVAKDERYYSSTTFSKAFIFVRKYGLLSGAHLEKFDSFVRDLAKRVSSQRAAFDEADIPAKYLCEMMADIMSDPVMFPQSKKIVDRWVAERQIMSADRDPYANTNLRVEDLIPLAELKEEIHRFAKEKGLALEGGNMFD